jgi:hypothetical protein
MSHLQPYKFVKLKVCKEESVSQFCNTQYLPDTKITSLHYSLPFPIFAGSNSSYND